MNTEWRVHIDSSGRVTDVSTDGQKREHAHIFTISRDKHNIFTVEGDLLWRCSPFDVINKKLVVNGIPGCNTSYSGIENILRAGWCSW